MKICFRRVKGGGGEILGYASIKFNTEDVFFRFNEIGVLVSGVMCEVESRLTGFRKNTEHLEEILEDCNNGWLVKQ